MKSGEFLRIYEHDPHLATIQEWLKEKEKQRFALRGLMGGMDAVVSAAVISSFDASHLFILSDREEAAYFQNDLQALLQDRDVLLFPTSYKKPYEVITTENANILQRAEVLNAVHQHHKKKGAIIVSYPDALSEKVINQRTLIKNTLLAQKGQELGPDFISEILVEYGFEGTDFVFEPGQFSVRGDIVDIFSFSAEKPYRLEFFGDEIESIRQFDPESQLSEEELESISIIPNVQTKLLQEKREPFLKFLPKETNMWVKDLSLTKEVVAKYFSKVQENFEAIKERSGNPYLLSNPDQLWDTPQEFEGQLLDHTIIEFGSTFYMHDRREIQFNALAQMSFNKDFTLFSDKVKELHDSHYQVYICSESAHQLDRIENILTEHDAKEHFVPLHFALREGFIDQTNSIAVFTDHQLFERFHKYKQKSRYTKSKALTIKEIKTLQPGDFVTHIDYGIGKFAGLGKVDIGGKSQEAVRIVYRDNDVLTVSMHNLHKISKYSGKETVPPRLSKLGSQEWEAKKSKAKRKIKDIAADLIQLYAKRKAAHGFKYGEDSYLQAELESSFIYEDTPDQAKATIAVKEDMEQPYPMDRLVCGDVGFGKTEIAIRAAFKAVVNGKQVAVLVPTTILAMQHFKTFSERYKGFPIKVDYINRFRSSKEISEVKAKLASGEIDVLIGTHKIVGKTIQFKNLGLLVIDEEQKFGVSVKEKLKQMRVNVDCLTLTATPIPRTLQFSLMGARDLSIISTPPPNRQPVTTEIHSFTEEFIRDAISYELSRSGQVFFVHNRVSDIEQIANIVLRLVPDAKVGVAHGQMESKQLEKSMLKFIEGEYDVLCSTNIVESGLDIPNANTIIINHAHMFGLSDLHQMRGRVGRSNRKAFCYLLTPSLAGLTSDARKRLKALEEFSELGSGFKVAMRDLDIRGAGNLLGGEQSGFITDIGFDMYHKILDEAISELKETDFKDLFASDVKEAARRIVQDCQIETDLEVIIPEEYVGSISERLELYTTLDNIQKEEELKQFEANLKDRFGRYPEPVERLIKTVRLRWLAEELGFERLTLKESKLKGYVTTEGNDHYFQGPTFGAVLDFVQNNAEIANLRDVKGKMMLVITKINTVDQAINALSSVIDSLSIEA